MDFEVSPMVPIGLWGKSTGDHWTLKWVQWCPLDFEVSPMVPIGLWDKSNGAHWTLRWVQWCPLDFEDKYSTTSVCKYHRALTVHLQYTYSAWYDQYMFDVLVRLFRYLRVRSWYLLYSKSHHVVFQPEKYNYSDPRASLCRKENVVTWTLLRLTFTKTSVAF